MSFKELLIQLRGVIPQDFRHQVIKANGDVVRMKVQVPFHFKAEKAKRTWGRLIHVRDELGDLRSNLVQTYAGG